MNGWNACARSVSALASLEFITSERPRYHACALVFPSLLCYTILTGRRAPPSWSAAVTSGAVPAGPHFCLGKVLSTRKIPRLPLSGGFLGVFRFLWVSSRRTASTPFQALQRRSEHKKRRRPPSTPFPLNIIENLLAKFEFSRPKSGRFPPLSVRFLSLPPALPVYPGFLNYPVPLHRG